MGGGGRRQPLQIVAAFQKADHTVVAMAAGGVHQLAGRPVEIVLDKVDLGQRVAVMRDPEDQVRSWYKYRSRDRLQDREAATDGLSFNDFVRDMLRDDPPPHARIGSQFRFLTSARKQLLVHHLFAYEDQPQLLAFLTDRFGSAIELERKNVSPPAEAPLDPGLRTKLRAARAEEFNLYERLREAGGHLVTQLN